MRSTAVGLFLLSGAGAGFQELVISQPPDVEVGIDSMPQLRRTLSDVRKTGLAMIRRSAPSRTASVRDTAERTCARGAGHGQGGLAKPGIQPGTQREHADALRRLAALACSGIKSAVTRSEQIH